MGIITDSSVKTKAGFGKLLYWGKKRNTSAFVVAGAWCSTDKTAGGRTKLKYCFPFAVRGFAEDALIDYATSLVKVVRPCDNDVCYAVNTVTRLFCVILDVWAACQDATVTQELLKEGFHR